MFLRCALCTSDTIVWLQSTKNRRYGLMPKTAGPGLLAHLYRLPTCTTAWLWGFCGKHSISSILFVCMVCHPGMCYCVWERYWFSLCISMWNGKDTLKVLLLLLSFVVCFTLAFLRQSPYVVLAALVLGSIPGLPQTHGSLLSAGITGLYYHIHQLLLVILYIGRALGYICFEISNTATSGGMLSLL